MRHAAPAFKRLEAIATIYTVLAGLAVVGGFGGLLFGLRAAFVMEATPMRTYAIFGALGQFAAGLIAGLGFFAFREVIYLLLAIEENSARGRADRPTTLLRVPWLSSLSRVLSGGSNAAARSEVFEVGRAAEDARLSRNVSAVAPDRIAL